MNKTRNDNSRLSTTLKAIETRCHDLENRVAYLSE